MTRVYSLNMNRGLNWYVVWFALYVLILYLLFSFPLFFHSNIEDEIAILVMYAVGAIVFSNVLGVMLAFQYLYDGFSDIWLYKFNEGQWLMSHSHGIGTKGFSFERIVENDVLCVVIGLIVILHILLSAKRCKEMGAKVWMALVPLYNPFVLFYKKGIERWFG